MGIERPQDRRAYAMAQRYQLGLNIALPADWAMQVYFSHTKDKEYFNNTQRRDQSLGVRGPGLDDPGDACRRHDPGDRHVDQAVQRAVSEPVLRPAGLQVQLGRPR